MAVIGERRERKREKIVVRYDGGDEGESDERTSEGGGGAAAAALKVAEKGKVRQQRGEGGRERERQWRRRWLRWRELLQLSIHPSIQFSQQLHESR